MEWDFLGLNSKNVAMAMPLKEEFQDASKNSGMFIILLLLVQILLLREINLVLHYKWRS